MNRNFASARCIVGNRVNWPAGCRSGRRRTASCGRRGCRTAWMQSPTTRRHHGLASSDPSPRSTTDNNHVCDRQTDRRTERLEQRSGWTCARLAYSQSRVVFTAAWSQHRTITHSGIGGRKPSCQSAARFVQSFRHNTGSWRRSLTRAILLTLGCGLSSTPPLISCSPQGSRSTLIYSVNYTFHWLYL